MSTPDPETLAIYDAQAAAYAERFDSAAPYPRLESFLDRLPAGGRVLDLGCGTGGMAARMHARGFDVLALDASAGMAAVARARHGVSVRQGSFDELPQLGTFDGIWAHFSLLHAAPEDLPRHFRALGAALRPGGHVLVGMKLGTGTARDRLGRRYCYVSEVELQGYLTGAGLVPDGVETGESRGFDGTLSPIIFATAHA